MKNAPKHIDQELLTRYFAGECSETEVAEVERWQAASAANAEEFLRWKKLWLLAEAPQHELQATPSKAALLALQKVKKSTLEAPAESESQTAPISIKKRTPWPWAVAASIVLLLGVFLVFQFQGDPENATLLVFETQKATATDTLPDGTIVTLNSNSSLEYPAQFGEGKREVTLIGEAYFDVFKDANHPFVIHTSTQANVEVLGTSFNVKALPSDKNVTVSVLTGVVQLSAKSNVAQAVVLNKGESGNFELASGEVKKLLHAVPNSSYWRNGSLEFDGVTLAEVFAILETEHHTTISVENSNVYQCKLTSSFLNNESLESILSVIADLFGLDIKKEGNQFNVTGEGCS